MKTSADRILTTHVGSLARPRALLETMREKEHRRPYDAELFARQVRDAVRDRVRRQVDVGLDVVTDGEQGKASFFTYVVERLDGYSAEEGEPVMPPSWRREIEAFPDFYGRYFTKYSETVVPLTAVACTGPVSYRGHDAVATDIANLCAALAAADGDVTEAFLPSTSPRGFGINRHYASDTEYLEAVAEALRTEYLAIVDAGVLLQIDDPWLIEILTGGPGSDPDARERMAHEHVDIVNHALRGIPPERVRLHTCYGLNAGPRIHDLDLAEIVPYMLRINAGGYSFEVANPRHWHEWKIWADLDLPDDKVLLPGFLGHATPYVEHPELIADGICNYASLVGRERVIASADCGWSSRATFAPEIPDEIVWEKFRALVDGARLATRRLWS
jgi:5-methyltetrahydropteroyltriglutamate--homocysteine methyltransferase